LNYDDKNQFQVYFRQHEYDPESNSFCLGTKIDFSGKNAAQIYMIIKAKIFDWNIFQPYSLNLSQFDIHYFRKSKIGDPSDQLETFM
jgi:hypothetical protein